MVTTYDTMDPERIASRSEFAAGLTQLREQAGLTVRELARELDISTSTLGGYLSGRHLPTAGQAHRLRTLVRVCGVTDVERVDAWVAALGRVRSASDRRLPRPPAPYRGLEPFEPGDAALFFGREDETREILDRLRALLADPGPSRGLLAVIGPSGSGKSSVLRAGVVAGIEAGELGRDVTCGLTVPGSDPLAAFMAAADAPDGGRNHVVVVDQFEETFTSVADPDDRAAFLRAVAGRPATTVVVLGMRADFYATAAAEPLLLAALQHAQVLIGPMSAGHVRDAVVRPAEAAGGSVDPGLVELVLTDLAPRDAGGHAHDAGGLPLLSHALLATWTRASALRLTVDDYTDSGGIDGAVQRTAEDLYTSLSLHHQELARRMFLRLVHLDDDVAVTRRRASQLELTQMDPDDDGSADAVLDAFVERRLLTAHENSVEVSHEALLSAWPRLRGWVDADRAGLRLHRQITEGANAWSAADRDPAALPRGTRLDAGAEWAADPDHRAELSPLETEFVEAAVAQRDAEVRVARGRTRRLRRLLVMVAVLAVVAGVLAVYSARARQRADDASATARSARDNALSRQVALQSRELTAQDPALAQQLALVALRIAPTEEARGTVMDESAQPVITRVLGALGQTAMAQSTGRNLIAVAHDDDGSVHLYARRSGAPPTPLAVVPGDAAHDRVVALAFTPDGRTLVTGGAAHAVQLFDVTDPRGPRLLASMPLASSDAVQALGVSPSGGTLVSAGSGAVPLHVWDIADRSAPRDLPTPAGVPADTVLHAVALDPDGSSVAAGDRNGTVRVWRLAALTAAPTSFSDGSPAVFSLLYASAGTLLVGNAGGEIQTWSVASRPTRTGLLRTPTNSQVNTMALSPDHSRLAVGNSDNSLLQYSFPARELETTTPNPGPVNNAAYSADGSQLITTCEDGTLRLMPALARPIPVTPTVFNLAYSADGSRLLVVNNQAAGGARLWDTRNRLHPVPLTPQIHLVGGTKPAGGSGAVSPSGDLVAIGNAAGQVQFWDTSTPAKPRAWGPPATLAGDLVEALVFTPDGKYLAVGSDDATVSIWDVRSPARPVRVSVVTGGGPFYSVDISSNGRLMAGADDDSHAYLWSIADPRHPVRLARLGGFVNEAYGVAFDHRVDRLAATGADHTTRVWDIRDPAHPRLAFGPLIGPTDYIYSASFDPQGRHLAVASNDRTVRIYDLATHSRVPVTTLRAVGSNVFIATYSPDGSTLVGGGRTSTVTLWSATPSGYADSLCAVAGDPITRDEWALYVPGAKYDPPCR